MKFLVVGGSSVLQGLSDSLGVPLIQINIISAELLALGLAVGYRHFLCPTKVSSSVRHFVALSLGACLLYFVFGSHSVHVVAQAVICYLACVIVPASIVHWVTFILAMTYLMVIHLDRVLGDETEKYPVDISAPLMLTTSKITILAFGIHDGCHRKLENLSDYHKRHALTRVPSLLEYFSYIFYFQSIIVGPPAFFSDYLDFVEGRNIHLAVSSKGENEINANYRRNGETGILQEKKIYHLPPSPLKPVCAKLCETLFWISLHVLVAPHFPALLNSDDSFAERYNIPTRMLYMIVSMSCCKIKYYIAWTLGDAVNNASGLGFNGYDTLGNPKWDLITNIRPISIEKSLSAKSFIDNWNIQTGLWLRYICYTRVGAQRTLSTFVLSALWHGCYPGYYFTFLSSALMIFSSRKVRHSIRPMFQTSPSLIVLYDIITWMFTQLYITYVGVPFNVLHYSNAMKFYGNMYWCLHILAIAAVPFTMFVIPPKPRSSKVKEETNDSTEKKIKSS